MDYFLQVYGIIFSYISAHYVVTTPHTVDIRLINITHAVLCQRLLWVDGIAGVDTSVSCG